MRASEIKNLFQNYECALGSPSRMSVILGCDCGCGGDYYTIDSYIAEEGAADKAVKDLKEAMENLGIEWDLEE